MQPVIDSTALPAFRRRTHGVLMVRDPNTLWAYWDYAPEDMDRLRAVLKSKSKNPRFLLRVYDVTLVKFNGTNANLAWDLEVGPDVKNAYINVRQDNADYCVEYGLSTGRKHFMALARSNTVRAPSRTPSKRDDLIWQDIKFNRESQAYIQEDLKHDIRGHYQGLMQQQQPRQQTKQQAKGHPPQGQGALIQQQIGQRYAQKERQIKHGRKPRIYHLTAEDIRVYYLRFFYRKTRHPRGLKSIIRGIPAGISWQKVRSLITALEWLKRTHPLGASEKEALRRQGTGASESLIAGQGSEGRLKKRKFFFEIWTELIVHGRTEPDAEVWLNQKGIKLNPDGTFTLRYALPDGEIPLKFIAQSADGGEQRHIYTRVEREKTGSFSKMLKAYE